MKREIIIGNYCRRCEYVMPRHILECRCIRHMTETAGAIHRETNWIPAYTRLTVTMESANR